MATVAPSSDTADLLQNLSLNSESKTIGVPEPAKKSGHGPANGVARPLNPNANFIPNERPSPTYYYGGYDRQGDWNNYSGYMNLNGGMTQGVLGDSCSYMYHQGFGYNPYGASVQHDDKLYGLQQYQYPSTYYQSPASANGSFAANQINVQQGKISTAVSAEHISATADINIGSTIGVVNEDSTNNNSLKEFSSSSQHSSLNSNDSYQRTGFPLYAPLSGYQDPSPHGTQPALPSDPLLFSDKQFNHGANIGLSSPAVPGKGFSSRRNTTIPEPLQQSMNLHGSRHSTGMEVFSGFINGVYPSNTIYSPYGNTYRASSLFGPAPYGYRIGSVNNKHKTISDGSVNHVKKNMDGFGELNKGPRAGNGSDDRSLKCLGPVTLLLKGQNLPTKGDNKEVPIVPNKEQYNGEDIPENYSDAKFFVIKSYSEDDVHKSIKYSVWASTLNGNKKLDAAYQEAKEKPGDCPVFLLFSVNTSGQFVGLAEMVSPVDFDRTVEYWQQDRWTGCFSVKWHIIKDIPNSMLRHITLANNENKPVTNSRDTQEVKIEKGIQILKIFKEHSSTACILDDFGFYEAREKMIQERKSKEQQFSKPVNISNDLTTNATVILPKSHYGTMINEAATTNAAGEGVTLVEVNGSTPASEDCSKSC